MPDLNQIPHPILPACQPGKAHGKAAARYAALFAAVQIGLIGLCMGIAARPWFLEHDGYPALRYTLGYSLRLHGANCEIVLYGDSAPLTGLDSAYIQQKTGLKSCNLSEFKSIHWVVGSYFPLDEYLAHNTRPKFILSEWSAGEPHPEPKGMVAYQGEGFEYAMLYAHGPSFWLGILRHPIWPVWFSIWVENRLINDATTRLNHTHAARWARERIPRDMRGGVWRDTIAEPETSCLTEDDVKPILTKHPFTRDETKAAIAQFKERYSIGGTHVLVDVSPIADCTTNREALIEATKGITDNQLAFLPVHYFNTQDVHFVPEGSRVVSEMAAEQILAIMQQDAAARKANLPSTEEAHSR